MMISVLSFGFKYGIPEDADLVFDVRFLPNPYYVDELRSLTGQDEGVFNYVMDNEIARQFAAKLDDMIKFLIPNYAKEGKTSLVIAIGCTGGKHRSVTLARVLYDKLIETENTESGWSIVILGMIPKLKNCIDAIEEGVNRVHILDGRIPHSLLLEIFTN